MPVATTNGVHLASPNKSQQQPINDDDQREIERPADVIEDMRQMGQRQRVKTILNSKEFRDELEAIINDALKHGPHSASIIALQQISELLLPHTSRWSTVSSLSRAGGSVIVPINDIRGVDSQGFSKSERLLRCKLASVYRLVDLFGWSQGIYNHITARVSQELEHFLINPFGLMYHEVTASSLVKVDIAGNVIDPGSTTYGINRAGYTIHSAIHKARPDLRCVIHLHTPAVAAVSAMKCGLLPLSQDALFCGKISYHDYRGILIEEDVKKLLVEDLGPINKVMILRNHGFVACGETIEEAWKYAFNVINACEVQVRAAPMGIDQLYLPSSEQQKRIADVLHGNMNEATGDKKWKVGELEFESLMRILDNAGFRTGYVYRQPLIRTLDKSITFKDVEVPPAASSATTFGDQSHPEAYSPTRQVQRTVEWRNSPNSYSKQEIEETGTPNPKKVTKWVPDAGLKHSTPIKIDTKHQFAPSNCDPKELKTHQKQMKEDRFNEKVSAGYQSKILETSSWDDASQMKDPQHPSTEAVVIVGAASKGIIKRDQQNNAVVYKTFYAQNPFAHIDNDEIERYKREVEEKQMREQASKKNALLNEIRKGNDSQYDDQVDGRVLIQPIRMSRTLSPDRLNDLSSSRMLNQTNTRTVPVTILPPSSSMTITQSTTYTQTTQETQSVVPSKSVPSFAETQLLSVYYPTNNPPKASNNDKCVFFEEQNRPPVRSRVTYNPSTPTKFTQTSPTSTPLSTHSSTIIIDRTHKPYPNYQQYVRLQSGSQNLANENIDVHTSPNELIDESNYSFEEYIVQVDKNENSKRPSTSSSTSSVTTVIEQSPKRDSRSTLDETSLSSSIQSPSPFSTDVITSQRISSWPPVPDDTDNCHETDEQRRSTRVQFAENLVRVMPTSTDTEIVSESVSSKNVEENRQSNNLNSRQISQQLQRFDYHPVVNQSRWVQSHIDQSDPQTGAAASRVNALRSIFEQPNSSSTDSSTLPSPKNVRQRIESNTSRSQSTESNTMTLHHAQPAQIIRHSSQDDSSNAPFKLDQIRQITGKPLKHINEVGYYLQDGRTWQWNEVFWLSLTNTQHDQLRDLEYQANSRLRTANHHIVTSTDTRTSSSNEINNGKPVTNIVVTSTSTKPKPSATTVVTAASNSNILPSSTSSTVIQKETMTTSSTTTKRTDHQIPHSISLDDGKQVERSFPKPVNPPQVDPLSYEQFVCDYLSDNGKHLRATDNSLIFSLDEQQISLPSIRFGSSVTKNILIEMIDKTFPPFETESNQLVIFLNGEIIKIPADRWLRFRKQYQTSTWLIQLKRVNRHIPPQSIPSVEQWLADHTKLLFDKRQMNVDGKIIPLLGQYGSRLIDSNRDDFWNEILKYLSQIGYVSYDVDGQIIHITDCELDIHRILVSPSGDLIERVTIYLRTLKSIHFENEKLFITNSFILPNQYINHLLVKHQQGEHFDLRELAQLLLQICHIDEDESNQSILLTFNRQVLHIMNHENNLHDSHIEILIHWLNNLNQHQLIEVTTNNDIILHPNNQKKKEQQIFIKHEHVEQYMNDKNVKQHSEVVQMIDIANILLSFNYVQYSSGQLIFSNRNTIIDTNELAWLKSIIRSVRSNEQTQQTDVELFDGESSQILQIPYENLPPTKNTHVVAGYLFQNGNIRYDVDSGNYVYRYVQPDQKNPSAEYTKQYELLSSHIRNIHIDKNSKRVLVEFIYDPHNYLIMPANWYQQVSERKFDRSYIIHMLLANGGHFKQDNFLFMDQTYALKLSTKQKESLIDYYVEYVNNQGEINYDNTMHILILESPLDSSKLLLTREHSDFIQKNNYQRKDMKALLLKYSEIEQDEFNNWLLYYNDQCVQIPLANPINEKTTEESRENQAELVRRFHATMDYMYHNNLITYDKYLKLYQVHFTNQILPIPYHDLRSIINIKNNNSSLPFASLQFAQWLLKSSDQINSTRDNQIEMIYKNKSYYLPMVPSNVQPTDHQRQETNPDLYLVFPSNNSLRSIQKTPSTTTLDIERPSATNNYTIDPLLILANYVHRAGSLYQDSLGRLIIKLNKNEIVIPRIEATSTIEAIHATPQRTGTIIARLLHRIGNIQSNRNGGIIITVGNISFEIAKEAIEGSNRSLIGSNHDLPADPRISRSPVLPSLKHSRSVGSLSSIDNADRSHSNSQQTTYIKDGRGDVRYVNLLPNENSPIPSRSIHVIRTNDETHVCVQYRDEHDMAYDNGSQFVRPVQSQIIDPNRYQDRTLRDVPVYVSKLRENKVYFDNLAEYLSSDRPYLSAVTVYHMLNFASRNEYLTYLTKKMSPSRANALVQNIGDFSSNERLHSIDYHNSNRQKSRSLDQLYESTTRQSNDDNEQISQNYRHRYS